MDEAAGWKPIISASDALLSGEKLVDVDALYDPDRYRARLLKVEGMPMFLY